MSAFIPAAIGAGTAAAGSALLPAMAIGGTVLGAREASRGRRALGRGRAYTKGFMYPGLEGGSKIPITYSTPGGSFTYQGGNVTGTASPFREQGMQNYDRIVELGRRQRGLTSAGMARVGAARDRAITNAMARERSNLQAQMQERNLRGSLFEVQGRNMLAADEARLRGDAGAQTFMEQHAMEMEGIKQEAMIGQQAGNQLAQLMTYDNNLMQLVFGGAENMQSYITNMNNILSGNATQIAKSRSAQVQGYGHLAGIGLERYV